MICNSTLSKRTKWPLNVKLGASINDSRPSKALKVEGRFCHITAWLAKQYFKTIRLPFPIKFGLWKKLQRWNRCSRSSNQRESQHLKSAIDTAYSFLTGWFSLAFTVLCYHSSELHNSLTDISMFTYFVVPVEDTLSLLTCHSYNNTRDWYTSAMLKQDLPKRYHYARSKRIDDIVMDVSDEYYVSR